MSLSTPFYPAVPSPTPAREPYFRHGRFSTDALARYGNVAPWILSHLALAQLPMARGALLAPADTLPALPVLLFSHGRGACPEVYSHLLLDLASHGWLVVAVHHRDGSACGVQRADGTALPYDTPAPDVVDDPARHHAFRHRQLQHRVMETRAALDHLSLANELVVPGLGLFHGRCDLRRVAVAGHSFGAATALLAAQADDRFRAVVALDPWRLPLADAALARGWQVPVLLSRSVEFLTGAEAAPLQQLVQAARQRAHPQSVLYTLAGSGHKHFCDVQAYSPVLNAWLQTPAQCGTLDPLRGLRLVKTLNVAFLQYACPCVRGLREWSGALTHDPNGRTWWGALFFLSSFSFAGTFLRKGQPSRRTPPKCCWSRCASGRWITNR